MISSREVRWEVRRTGVDVEVLGFGLAGVKTGLSPTDRETGDGRREMN